MRASPFFGLFRPPPDNPCTYVLSTPCRGRGVDDSLCARGLGQKMRCAIHLRLRRGERKTWSFGRGGRSYEMVEDPLSADFGVRHAWLIFMVEPEKVDVPVFIEGVRHHTSLREAKQALARHLASSEPDLF